MTRRFWIGVLGLGTVCLAGTALAAPPQNRLTHAPNPPSSMQQHLDLRAPSHALDQAPFAAERDTLNRFGALAQRQNIAPQEAAQLPAMSADGMRTRPRLEEFVRRVHQEGLPVARLFESKTALVHLGLSPKGKPGLWLVQKTH